MTTTTRDPADIERELGQIASRSRALFSQHRTYEQMPQSAKDEVKGLAARDHALQEELASIPVTRNPWALKQPIAAGGGGGFAASIIDQGFDLKTRNKVEIPGTALVQKANTFPAVNTWNVTAPNLIGLGQDSRWLFPNLPTQDASNLSAISDFKQTVRTLTGNPIRNLDASTVKANVDVTLTSVVEPLHQIAVTINDIPAALFDSVPTMQAFLEAEARFQVFTALDSHVLAQIVAATPAFGNNGTPSMIAMLRNAITSMRAAGADPDLAVLNPADAAALDLATTGGDAQYVFALRDTGDSSPLWGLEIIERIGGGTDPPYVIDRDMLGVLYLGDLSVQADPYSGFKSNLVTLRVEVNALFHVRNIQGARRVAAT